VVGLLRDQLNCCEFRENIIIIIIIIIIITPWSRVLLEKLTGRQLVRNSLHFMEPEGSLPHSKEPSTCPYPEPYQSSPFPPSHFLEDPF
jgi:hypothetical protein